MLFYLNEWVFFSHKASNLCAILIAYHGKTYFILNKQKTGKAGRISILDVTLYADQYIVINLCNPNTETEQWKISKELQSLSKSFQINENKRIIFASDFNIIINSKLGARCSKPLPKRNSVVKLADIKKSLDICNIWIIGSPTCQNLILRQNHSTGLIERRLITLSFLTAFKNLLTTHYLLYQHVILQDWSGFQMIILIIVVFGKSIAS